MRFQPYRAILILLNQVKHRFTPSAVLQSVILSLSLLSPLHRANAATVYTEQGQLVRAGQTIKALGPNLFGDQVSPYNGSLHFIQTDIDLPGNSALSVALGRRLGAGVASAQHNGHFGNWDLEIPRISGIFSRRFPFTAIDYSNNRCSTYSRPPNKVGNTTFGYFDAEEYWHGNMLYIPGIGEKEILNRADAKVPQDGNQYPLMTQNRWMIRCIPLATGNGEGFMVVSPDGTQYQMDRMLIRSASTLERGTVFPSLSSKTTTTGKNVIPTVAPSYTLLRSEVWIVPSRIQDRFGNTVNFEWGEGWQLKRIVASDGRAINFSYSGDTIRTASDGLRTWTYDYNAEKILATVRLPDGSSWSLDQKNEPYWDNDYYVGYPGCEINNQVAKAIPGTLNSWEPALSMTHPSGATAQFLMRPTHHARSNVHSLRCVSDGTPGIPTRPLGSPYYTVISLVSKTLGGAGLPALTWTYQYGPAEGSSYTECQSGCAQTKWVETTTPTGKRTRLTFGTNVATNEGQVLEEQVYDSTGQIVQSTNFSYRRHDAGPYAPALGYSLLRFDDGDAGTRQRPLESRTQNQQGHSFTWQANSFDTFARVNRVTKSSSLGSYKTEATDYYDDLGKWVINQIQRHSVNEIETQRSIYDETTALPKTKIQFGLPLESYTYHPDGTLKTLTDGRGNTTQYSNYKLGLAQNIGYADGSTQNAVVNDLGLITALTNEAGTTTGYAYDAMGRLNRITPPADSNLAYYPTVLTFEPVGTDEYGLSPGHWRQTSVTGNAVTIHYFDAMWRKRISKTYDAANPGATQTMRTYQWDAEGRLTYQSFPQANIADIYTTNGIYGQRQWYDALGRITDVWSDSELGILKKRTDYLTGFQTQTTDARGNTSIQTHLAYDDPAQAWLSRIRAPQGLNLDIVRDVFGKPLSITRSGTNAGTTTSVTRVYVYDGNQRLCKTIEPELGASLQDWDAAGNLAWKSGGTSLTSQACDRANVAGSSKISHSYDARNRLDSTRYGDGSPAIIRRYTPDGLLATVDNGVSRWSYAYNNRRLLNRETLQFNNHEWNLFHIPDAYGHTAALYYPDGTQIAYAPNALGQATQVGAYANAITYHPNGEVASYRYGNGIAHSVTQNLRGLPATLSDAGISANQYGYDQNANVSAITDVFDGSTSRSMQYDALDRLIAVNAPGLWGQASYAYDVQDNLRQSNVGARNLTHQYDSNNRLSAISGSQNQSYTFDPNGNLSTRGNDRFSFDLANRLRSATTNAATANAAASYIYDGHGRRIFTARDNNPGRFQLYSQAGQQLWASGEQSASNYPASSNPTCPSGWTASANLCVRTETQSASLAYSCPNGGTLSGTVCNITTSTPATRTAYCPGDDSLRKRPASGSGATTQLLCPNMQWIYTCPNGGTLSGRQCLTSTSQAASVTPSCPQGWNIDGQTCRRLLTQNPTPAYTCPDGGTLNGSTCTIAGGSYTTKYHYLAGKVIAEVSNAQVRYTHTDALGSPVAISDANGTLISRTRYEAYGNTHSGAVPGQANASSLGFTGHVNDPDTGLVYMQQRYYDPVAGRFLSTDPVVTDADTGKSFNRYEYASSNPYKNFDPDGRNPVLASRVMYTLAFRAATWAGAGTLGSLIGIGIYDAIHKDPVQSNGPKVPTNIQPNTNPPQSPVIPGDWESRPGSKGGEIFYPPGTDPANGENIRVMPPGHSPVPGLEDGYWVWTGPNGQPLDPKTGKPGGKGSTHVPLPPNSVPPARPQKPTEPPKPPDTTTE